MIVDFQHHFTPRELIKDDPGDRLVLHYDALGAPSYTVHSLLYDLDEHVCMMELAGIDAAWLTSAAGICADLETSRLVNDRAAQAERDYRGRFIGAAHAHPLGGAAAFKELARCRHELGFQGVVITSEFEGKFIDDPAPYYEGFGQTNSYSLRMGTPGVDYSDTRTNLQDAPYRPADHVRERTRSTQTCRRGSASGHAEIELEPDLAP